MSKKRGEYNIDVYCSGCRAQIFRYTPTITMHVDNWGEEYAREPDK